MKPIRFLREIRSEATKITWPDMKSARMFTLGVFILAILIGAYLWGIDVLVSSGLSWIIGA